MANFAVLHEDHSDAHHGNTHEMMVRLSECYGGNRWSTVTELLMKQFRDGVELIRFSSDREDGPAQVYHLSGEEIDALIDARLAFKQSIVDFEHATEERIAQEIEQARALVESVCPEWSLEQDGDYYVLMNQNLQHIINPTPAYSVLATVRAYLVQKKLIEDDQPKNPDDFDPFLDSDELP